jgi:phospholipid/cholesterol/gamma-HCH transport system substrate-binding protein
MRSAIAKHLRDFVALVALAAVAIGAGGYILAHQRLRFPVLEDKPFVIKAEFSDAQAVVPGQGQTIRIAGMRVGDIGKVELENGKAIVHMELDREFEGIVHTDATALLRPRTGLKDMFIELDPGTRTAPVMEENDRITLDRTAPDVDADEVLSALDRDTRDYLVLLINGAGNGLRGRAGDLREVFRRLGPLHRDVSRVNGEIAKRRRNLARLVHNYGSTISELAKRDRELTRFVTSANATFESWSREDQNIALAVSRLPRTLDQVERTLQTVNVLGQEIPPGLNAMRPAVRQLDRTNDQVRPFAREAAPILQTRIRPFVRQARPYVGTVRPAARNLAKASPDLRESFYELNRLFNMLAYNPRGRESLTGNVAADRRRDEGMLFWLSWVAQNTVSMFNSADASGPFRRIVLYATCSTFQNQVEQEPIRELLFNVTDLLNDPGLCPAE